MSRATPVIVIFGAKVERGGGPSGSLLRRIVAAFDLGQSQVDARFIATGAVGDHPPSEASVIGRELERRGIDSSRILLDEASYDTLESVRNCLPLVAATPEPRDVIVCTDRFHTMRCAWLFRIYGIPARRARIPSARGQLGLRGLAWYWLRDLAGIAVDVPQAWLDRGRRV